jgi:hypothetical protein
MDIQVGYWRWKIYRWNEHPNPFRGRSDLALEWLRRFQKDRMVMSELRAQLSRAGLDAQLGSADDNRVLQEVAVRLSSGEFQVCAESSHPFQTAVASVTPTDPEAEAAAEILNAPPAPTPTPAPKPEPAPAPTLAGDADAAMIAEVLKQAAQTGAPFCEECQKAKQAQAKVQPASAPQPAAAASPGVAATPAAVATPDAADATFPSSADTAAIATALQTAARNGDTFCVESDRVSPADTGQT